MGTGENVNTRTDETAQVDEEDDTGSLDWPDYPDCEACFDCGGLGCDYCRHTGLIPLTTWRKAMGYAE